MDIEVNAAVATLQRDVQRKLGGFLIGIQQCEHLLKALVIDAEQAGTVDTLSSFREERTKRFSNKSLGQVVDELKTSYLKVVSPPGADEPEVAPGEVSVNKPFFRVKASMEMSSADFADTSKELAKLVERRNRLVHHLIEDFNVWTLDGCNAALKSLDASFEAVEATFSKLKRCTETSRQAASLHAAVVQSPEFIDMLIYGVMPDGTVQWDGSPVVAALQEIEAEAAVAGWVSLETAIASIQARHTDLTPQRYKCRTWRQVLTRSQLFEIQKVEATAESPGRTLYRTRSAETNLSGQSSDK